jgi:CysZ protein
MVLALVLITGAWILLYHTVDSAIAWIWPKPDGDAWWGVLHFLYNALKVVLWLLLSVGATLLTVFTYSLLAAPFSDTLSEQVEAILGTWSAGEFSLAFMFKDLGETVKLEISRLGVKLAWLVPLFVLSIVLPIPGHLLNVGVGGYILCKYTGMDYVDWCAARRGWSWEERLAFAKRHRAAILGLGAAVVLSFFIPLLFVFVWPAAVAAGTLLFTDLIRADEAGNLGPGQSS